MLYHWFLERTSFQFLNMNGAKGKDLYSDTGAVWLQGFPTFLLTYCLCKCFNDRILMLNQSLLKWPQVFLLAVSKDQGFSDWHWAKQMFIRYRTNGFLWHSNVWAKRNKKIEPDWKKRTFILFLKHLSKQIMSFTTLVWKRLLGLF